MRREGSSQTSRGAKAFEEQWGQKWHAQVTASQPLSISRGWPWVSRTRKGGAGTEKVLDFRVWTLESTLSIPTAIGVGQPLSLSFNYQSLIHLPSLVAQPRKRICLQCGRPGFDPRGGKIPWRRERLPTPGFWPGEFHGLCGPWGCRVRHDWATFTLSVSLPLASSPLNLWSNLLCLKPENAHARALLKIKSSQAPHSQRVLSPYVSQSSFLSLAVRNPDVGYPSSTPTNPLVPHHLHPLPADSILHTLIYQMIMNWLAKVAIMSISLWGKGLDFILVMSSNS